MNGMKGPGARIALVLAMPLLIVPLAALTWLAVRGVDQQESAMRARLRESLLLEVGQTNGRIRAWFDDLPAYLGESAPGRNSDRRPRAAELADWKEREPLVGIPFLLDSAGSIVYPEAAKAGQSDDETRRFYWRYLNVFGNQEPIPVYRNIAEEYESSIVGRQAAATQADAPAVSAAPVEPVPAELAAEDAVATGTPVPAADAPALAEPDELAEPASAAPTGPAAEAPVVTGTPVPAADAPVPKSAVAESAPAAEDTAPAPLRSAPAFAEAELPELAAEPAAPAGTPAGSTTPSAGRSATDTPKSAPTTKKSAPAARSVPAPSAAKSAAVRREDRTVQSKVAQSLFESDVEVQRQVYDLAAGEGKETLKRNVNPRIDASNTRESAPPRSVIIESSRYFRDIVAGAERGLVPRIFDNSFVLIYWERRGDWIVGCELDMEAVRGAVAARSGNPSDGVRSLAVLDQTGTPVVPVAGVEPEAWRTPLVSGEISEYLPYWETAVILSDASAFESRVRASRYALSALVLALALSVSLGAVVLWRYSANQLLEAKRRTGFVTTVSHELKTPLTSIRMYSEMLAEGADDDPGKRGKYLSRIVSESERLTRLINDVLDVAKLERGNRQLNPAPMDLSAVAHEAFDGLADRLRAEGFTVAFSAPEGSVGTFADREAVIRILLNLLSNAEKYSAERREIDMRVSTGQDGARCLVSVADRGIGVPRAHRSRIFREFHRVDSSLTSERGGTGLGLSIARSLARAMGGDVAYEPRERVDGQGGSVFTLSLPASADKGESS